MFRLALSLGYPHPDLMLSQMTTRQYVELMKYFELEGNRIEDKRAEVNEILTFERLEAQFRNQGT